MSRPRSPATSPLRGRYLVRNRAWNAWLRVKDGWLALRHAAGPASRPPAAPRRLLVAVGGHLGDAVIASTLLRHARRAFPGVEIGILTSTGNRVVFSDDSRVRSIHCVDHWKLSRARASFIARWKTTRRTAGLALREIRDARYDAAIDTAAYYPNFARIVWRAGIPTRVGFTSGGEGPLYTHPVPWTEGRHAARDALALLRELAPGYDDGGDLSYDLSAVAPDGRARVEALLARAGTRPGDYVVLHAGAGHPRKEWPIDRWRSVARSLADAGVPLVLTGAGSEQLRAADELERAVPEALNLSDRLTWPEFRAVIAGARLLLSVDTVAMHLAGASGVPCVALMTGIDRPERWNPLGGHATILTAPVPCAPCFRSRGCGEMSCVRDIDVDRVLAAARPHLPP